MRSLYGRWSAATSVAIFAPWATGQAPVITDLGVLPGLVRSRAAAVSADGSAAAGVCADWVRWTASQGIEDLGVLPGWSIAEALGISGDGSIVVGYAAEYTYSSSRAAFRWTPQAGLQQLSPSPSSAFAVSRDGSTIVGAANGQACRWTAAGLETIGPGTTAAYAVSADGSVIVGRAGSQAFRWTASGGVQYLGTAPGASYSYATGVNGDGSIVVGVSGTPINQWPGGSFFRWTTAGMQNLGGGGGTTTARPTGLNPDGSIVVGYSELDFSLWSPLIWTADLGTIDARAVLPTMGVNLGNWDPRQIGAMSPDGSALVGWGFHGSAERAFLITGLPSTVCYANCDGSTVPPVLNVADFTCFAAAFAAAAGYPPFAQEGQYANCDRSAQPRSLDVNDFICFMARFAAGCR